MAPPRPAEEPPNCQFNHTYFTSNFCNPTSSAWQTASEEARPNPEKPRTQGRWRGFLVILVEKQKAWPFRSWERNGGCRG